MRLLEQGVGFHGLFGEVSQEVAQLKQRALFGVTAEWFVYQQAAELKLRGYFMKPCGRWGRPVSVTDDG
jgi:hypothetical protein